MCAKRYDDDEADVAAAQPWLLVIAIVVLVALIFAVIGVIALLVL